MPTPTVINKYRYSDSISRREWDQNYFFDQMNINPVCSNLTAGGAAAGAGAEVDSVWTGKTMLEQFNIVANANISPVLDGSFGLNLAADAVDGDGVEYDTGITPQNPFTFKIDTSGNTTPAFFMRGNFKVATAAGVDPLIIGFRVLAARNADYTMYTNLATIGLIGGAAEFWTFTSKASVTGTFDMNLAAVDATAFQLTVLVDKFGNVTYQINGQTPAAARPYQFLNGITVMPFINVTQSATTTATASCNYLECGFQS